MGNSNTNYNKIKLKDERELLIDIALKNMHTLSHELIYGHEIEHFSSFKF